MTDDERWRHAWHEAGHAVVAFWVLGPESVELVSLRPGEGHGAVTLLAEDQEYPAADRIVVTLAGGIAAWLTEPIGDIVADERVADAVSLEHLGAAPRARLLAAEAEPEHPGEWDDESTAFHRAMTLADRNALEAGLLLTYQRARATRLVRSHLHALRAVAPALFRETTIDGARLAALTRGSRCVCHWRTSPERSAMAQPPTTKPQSNTEST